MVFKSFFLKILIDIKKTVESTPLFCKNTNFNYKLLNLKVSKEATLNLQICFFYLKNSKKNIFLKFIK